MYGVFLTAAVLHLQATPTDIVVRPARDAHAVAAALVRAHPGDRIVITAGTYREPTIVVRTPRVTIEGQGWPVIDGQNQHAVLIIEADSVTVRGLVLENTGVANIEDRAGVRARNVRGCTIEHNRLRDNLFGVYLEKTTG